MCGSHESRFIQKGDKLREQLDEKKTRQNRVSKLWNVRANCCISIRAWALNLSLGLSVWDLRQDKRRMQLQPVCHQVQRWRKQGFTGSPAHREDAFCPKCHELKGRFQQDFCSTSESHTAAAAVGNNKIYGCTYANDLQQQSSRLFHIASVKAQQHLSPFSP